MSSEIRKRIKTPTGLFFTSFEMRERVWVRVDLFLDPVGSFSRDSFFLTLACYSGNRKSKVGKSKMNCMIRNMIKSDIESLSHGFINQGWPGREEILARYFLEQESGEREVLVAEIDGAVAGYVTILPSAKHGPFAEVYPELSDFNVFEPFRNQGIGNQLLEEAEKRVKFVSSKVTIGVGLHLGYGPAQRLYIKRGYIPDGTGVWYRNKPLEMNATSQNNDDLVLYLVKEFG